MKKLLSILLCVSTIACAQADQTFIDVYTTSWEFYYVEDLVSQGIIDDGYYFHPNRPLNRAELVKIMVLSTTGVLDDQFTGTPTFPDVSSDQWYYPYIETAVITGIINGYPDGYFRPGQLVNRAEAIKIIVNGLGLEKKTVATPFRDYDMYAWFHPYVMAAYEANIISGKTISGKKVLEPGSHVLRSEMAKMVSLALKNSTYY